MFYLRDATVALKPKVTLNLIHASHCQNNFPNVCKPYGVQFKVIGAYFLQSIFKVQVLAKVMDSDIYSYKSNKDDVA